MKINRIDLYFVKIPLEKNAPGFFGNPRYFLPSWIPGFRQSEMRFYLLRLGTDKGVDGVAAMPAMGSERMGLGPLMGNYIMGINPMDIELVNQRIQEFSYIGMRNGWIDAAFWDIIGKIKGAPLWKILGGTGGSVYPYLSTGATHGHDPEKIRDICKQVQDAGYRGMKLRVKGTTLALMTDFVGAARDALGRETDLMVDANQGWPVDLLDETPKWNLEFAMKFARSIETFDIKWLEEPLNRGDFEGLAELRKNTNTPIAGGEMNSTWCDFKTMLGLGSLDVYQPDAVLAGGTYAGGVSVVTWLIREIRRYNQQKKKSAKGIKYSPHTWTTGLGFALALQLVGVLPPEERGLLEYPVEGHWNPGVWARFIRGGFDRDPEGRIQIPDGPGLGVEIDWNVIRRFGRRIYHGTAATVASDTLRDRGLRQTLYLKNKKKEQLERSAKAQFRVPDPRF
ncbi:mandelate racemase/muconate lactonizing enzyme family protein [bacterium]|nr:mandelate racemase/muconate lactonizing enzyme family protein [bacterium]